MKNAIDLIPCTVELERLKIFLGAWSQLNQQIAFKRDAVYVVSPKFVTNFKWKAPVGEHYLHSICKTSFSRKIPS